MTLVPLADIVLTDKEKYEHLKFRKTKLIKLCQTERHEYKRKQYQGQISQIDRQLRELKPIVKKAMFKDNAESVTFEKAFRWEAKAYLIKPIYDEICERALKRMRIEQSIRLEGK